MELAFGRPLFDRFAHGSANLPGRYENGLAALLEDARSALWSSGRCRTRART
jgi:hypothetical protein